MKPLSKALALAARSHQRMLQPVWVVHTLGIARHLGADDACRDNCCLGAAHTADHALVEQFNIEGASGRTVMRASRMADPDIRYGVCRFMIVYYPQSFASRNEFLPDDCAPDEINFHDRRSAIAPATMNPAATKRGRPTFFSISAEMSIPKRIAVSRSAATTAIGAMVIAQSASP